LARVSYWLICGIKATGKRVQVPDFAIWRFEDGKIVEISTIQDQFALLKRNGYLPGDVYTA
jgi:predicted ester cyclase